MIALEVIEKMISPDVGCDGAIAECLEVVLCVRKEHIQTAYCPFDEKQ